MRKSTTIEVYEQDLTHEGGGITVIRLVQVLYDTGYAPGDGRGQQSSYVYVLVDDEQVATFDSAFEARGYVIETYPEARSFRSHIF